MGVEDHDLVLVRLVDEDALHRGRVRRHHREVAADHADDALHRLRLPPVGLGFVGKGNGERDLGEERAEAREVFGDWEVEFGFGSKKGTN